MSNTIPKEVQDKINILIDAGRGHLFSLPEREMIFNAMDEYALRLQQENERLKEELSKEVGMAKINFKKYQDDIELIASLRKALQDLVDLKDYKDVQGKSPEYLLKQPKAWEAARTALSAPVEQDDQNELRKDATELYRSYFQSLSDRILRDKGAANKDVEEAINYTIKELSAYFKITKL